jgi:hypothetical protein
VDEIGIDGGGKAALPPTDGELWLEGTTTCR